MKQELTTSKQIVEEEQRCKRECKGRALAISRKIYRLLQTEDVFYVESESTDNVYYFVKFKPDVIEYCTCPDNSMRTGRQMRCKHLHAIEFAIRMGTLKDTDKLPADATKKRESKSYTGDEYSF